MPLNREEDLLWNTSILHTFYPKITFPWGGAMTFIISCLLVNRTDAIYIVLEMKMFTNDGRWRAPTESFALIREKKIPYENELNCKMGCKTRAWPWISKLIYSLTVST